MDIHMGIPTGENHIPIPIQRRSQGGARWCTLCGPKYLPSLLKLVRSGDANHLAGVQKYQIALYEPTYTPNQNINLLVNNKLLNTKK